MLPGRITFLSWRDTGHPDGGGSEVYVEQLARELVARGHEVTIVCAAHPGAPRDEDVQGVRFRRRGGRLSVYPRALVHLLGREGRRQDLVVDVINGLPFGAPLVRRRGLVALVHHVHREQWRIIYPGLAGRVGWFVESHLVPALYRRVPFVTVSEASRRDLVSLGVPAGRVHVVRNGLKETSERRADRSTTPRLCVLTRLVPHKQVEHAVDAAAILAPEFPGLRLDVIGSGWWADAVSDRVRATSAEAVVRLHGHVDEETKGALLDEAWLMLLPSVKEGWGLAVVEGAAHGVPTVAYRGAGGVTESVVDGETGVLVSGPEKLVEVTRGLLRSPEELHRMGELARRWSATFSWSRTADEFEAVLDGLAQEP